MRLITIPIVVAVFSAALTAATLHVPSQFTTIQLAIDAAAPGDTVLVAPGTYVENILFMGKPITVKSSDGPYFTVIDAGSPVDPDYGSGVAFCHGEGPLSVIDGFTVTNGSGTLWQNKGYCGGAGIASLWSSKALVENNIVANNSESGGEGGGGIGCGIGSQMTISNNLIYANRTELSTKSTGTGGKDEEAQSAFSLPPLGSTCGAISVFGGGVACGDGTKTTLINNTIYGNYAEGAGGGIATGILSETTVINTILWNNDATVAPEILLGRDPSYGATMTISYSDVQGGQAEIVMMPFAVLNWGTGMIDEDPLFTSPAFEIFNLRQPPCQPGVMNPCVDAGDPTSPADGTTRTDGVGDTGIVDLGYHYPVFTMPGGTALQVDVHVVQASLGGPLHFDLDAGPGYANRPWGLFVGVSGCYPGTELPDGTVLPINFDVVTYLLMGMGLPGFGSLDGNGKDFLDLYIPPVSATMDIMLYFAFACPYTMPDGWFASNAVTVLIDTP